MKTFQKHTRTIAILLLIALLVALFFAPNATQILSTFTIVFGIGTTIIFTVKTNREEQEEKILNNRQFLKNTLLDLLGLAIVMGLAIFFGRMAGNYAGQNWGLLAGILAGMATGFGIGFLAQKGWGKVAERTRGQQHLGKKQRKSRSI